MIFTFSQWKTSKSVAISMSVEIWNKNFEIPKNIEAYFKNCQPYQAALIRFRTSVPTEISLVFEDAVPANLMGLSKKAVIHVSKTDTSFFSKTFSDAQKSNYRQFKKDACIAFMKYWCRMYTEYPYKNVYDEWSVLDPKSKWNFPGALVRILEFLKLDHTYH